MEPPFTKHPWSDTRYAYRSTARWNVDPVFIEFPRDDGEHAEYGCGHREKYTNSGGFAYL